MVDKLFFVNTSKFTTRIYLYFSVVFLVNFFLKIYQLEFSSFWFDEIICVQSASLDFGHIKHVSEWDNNPPFYFYCLSVWIKLINDSEFIVRLLSVVFSSLAAGFVFVLANKFFNKTTAVISSFLFISSNILFFYSHEARAYSLVLLLSLISTYYYFCLKENQVIKYVILLGLLNFLLIYTHYISGIIIVFQTVLALLYFNKNQKKYFSYSLLVLIFFTILRFTKKQILLVIAFNSSEKNFWLQKSEFNYLIEVLSEFFLNQYLIIPFILLIGFSFVFLRIKKDSAINFYLFYFILVGFGSIITVYLLGKITPIFLDRYLVFTVPFIFILTAFSLSLIKQKIIPITFSIILFVFFAFKIDYKTPKSMDYRSVVSFVKSIKSDSDLIIVKTKDVKSLFCYYYDHDYLRDKKSDLPKGENIIFCSNWSEVYVDVSKYERIIILDSFQEYNPDEKDFVNKLSIKKMNYYTTTFYRGVKVSFYK